MKEVKYHFNENNGILIIENSSQKASKLWVEYDKDLGEEMTNKISTNYIVGQREYYLGYKKAKIIKVWIE